jgi:hypothetical protein
MSVVGSAEPINMPEGNFGLGRQMVRVPYRVIVNSQNDGPLTVASAPGLPVIYSTYAWGSESNDELVLTRFESKRQGSSKTLTWIVEAIYETPETKEGRSNRDAGAGTGRRTAGEFTNPLLEIPTVKWHSSGREALLTRIYDNTTGIVKPCTASNGEVFDPPPKFIETFATLEIQRNESIAANQPGIAALYTNAINSDVFWGLPAGYWRFKEIVPERQDRQIPVAPYKFPFLRVSYVAEYNPAGWDIQLLDYGSYYWERPVNSPGGAAGAIPARRIKIKTADGHDTSAPLNGYGMPLPDRVPWTPVTGAGPGAVTIAATSPIQKFNVGDLIQFTAIPTTGSPPSSVVAPAPLSFNTVYYVISNTVTAGAQAIDVSTTPGGARIALTTTGTGWQYAYSPGVFFTIRPYNRLPFAALGLPQSFAAVQ